MDSIFPTPLVSSNLIMGSAEHWCFSAKTLTPAEMPGSNHIVSGLSLLESAGLSNLWARETVE